MKEEEESGDEIIFTSVDADIERLTYQQDCSSIEAPFSENELGIGIPSTLRHGYIMPSVAINKKPYVPSSPKSLISMRKKRAYEPSSPRLESRRYNNQDVD